MFCFKYCSLCKKVFPKEILSKIRGWCPECKENQIKAQAIKSYHKNKHKYPVKLKGTDEKSKEQRRRSYHKNKNNNSYLESIVNKIFKSTKHRAKRDGKNFDLTLLFMESLYELQEGKCALTKICFSDEKQDGCMRRPFAPSLDRIDNKKGYTKDNVRFVCTIVNMALNEFGEFTFRKMCEAYVKNIIRSR